MREEYDVVIVGAATSGSFFAERMAKHGCSVLVLEAKSEAQVGAKYDIFHIAKPDFSRFGLPLPAAGDDLAFEFTGGVSCSAFGRHAKPSNNTTVGMHMHAYTLRMNRFARDAGAEILYEAPFLDFVYEDGRIAGVKFICGGQERRVRARLVADCSGIPSAARRRLPDGYGVENFEITPAEMFYVTLRYVKYQDPADYVHKIRSWPYFKTWEAPEADPAGAILGVGASFGFDEGERVFAAFERAVPLPKYTLKYVERGATPYRRPPYSFVADGFVVMGDAACLTKPSAGEGVTSSMVQIEIAAEVAGALMKRPGYLTREALWPINKRYVEAQGKAFAGQLATLAGAMATSAKENDFFFEQDIIFSKKSFESMGKGEPLAFTGKELILTALKMAGGVLSGRLRLRTIRALLRAMKNGERMTELYGRYPETPAGFDAFVRAADAAWAAAGSMADAAAQAN